MKNTDRLFSALCGAVLAFCIAFGGIACQVTAFNFTQISLGTIALWLAVATVLIGTGFALKKGWAPLPLLLLALLYTWYDGSLLLSLESLVKHISEFYHHGYGWGIVQWSTNALHQTDMTLVLCLIGTGIAYLLCWMVSRQQMGWLAVPVSVLPLISCLVVTDTVPEIWCLGLYFGALGLLLLTSAVRLQSESRANRLTATLLLPVALAVSVLFLASPRDTYDGQKHAMRWSDYFVDHFNTLFPGLSAIPGDAPGPYAGNPGETVDLQAVGPREDRLTLVMDVTAAQNGPLYLRGRAYDTYDGVSWSASSLKGMDSRPNWYSSNRTVGTVTIKTQDIHSVRYIPYNVNYSEPYNSITQGMTPNPRNLLEYSFTQTKAPTLDTQSNYVDQSLADSALEQYRAMLALPEQTREMARQYLAEHIPLLAEYFAYEEYHDYLMQYFLSSTITSSAPFYPADESRTGESVDSENPGSPEETGTDEPEKPESYDSFARMSESDRQKLLTKAIADFVQNSAAYSPDTPQMPDGEKDFALWFLEGSDTGYCIHYATAATVLLRAAGIPARYVTGYMVQGRRGSSVAVREKDAHAWVEVYLMGQIGWTMVEVTGGFDEEPSVPTQAPNEITAPPTAPPETTRPPETTGPAVTRPTEPKPTEPSGEEDSPMNLALLLELLTWLTTLTLAAAMLLGQRYLRLQLRNRRFTRGTPNARALARWRELERLCRMLKQEPDDSLVSLAKKAKFSQHTLTEGELSTLDAALEAAQSRLRAKPWPQRLWYTLARAAC